MLGPLDALYVNTLLNHLPQRAEEGRGTFAMNKFICTGQAGLSFTVAPSKSIL